LVLQKAVASLKRHRVKQHEERLKRGPEWNAQQLVFCTTTGTAYARNNWRLLQYIPMLAKAGLPYIRPHDLRHTAATLLLLEGVQPLVVSEMLGHASVAFTLAIYGHVLAEMRKPARDAMERLFGGVFAQIGGRTGGKMPHRPLCYLDNPLKFRAALPGFEPGCSV
jgi:integrase